MYTFLFKKVGWKFFVAGLGTAVVGSAFVRPALVGAVKVGLGAQEMATDVWNKAKVQTSSLMDEAASIRDEAEASRHTPTTTTSSTVVSDSITSELISELRRLREDVATLKSQLPVTAV